VEADIDYRITALVDPSKGEYKAQACIIACFRQPQPDVSLQLAASVLALHAREVKRPSFMETLGLAILVVIVAAAVLELVFYVR
jgi:hypothetical protein